MFLKNNLNFCKNIKKKKELLEEVKVSLVEYFKTRGYSTELINEIVSEDFIRSNPNYYLYYPYLFNTYFQITDKETLNLLSISGFLYYKAVILIDSIFDNKHSEKKFHEFFIVSICQEETVKILSSFFSVKSDFWQTWNARKFEYAKAYKLDKTLKTIENFSDFEYLADFKSTFGKIAIDCLYHLSDKKEKTLYKALLESHKFFYVGFQIMDDIVDYSEDIENGQFNISKNELVKMLSKENDSLENYSLEEQKKLIYLKGVAENLYKKSTKYLDKSFQLQVGFQNDGNSFWVDEINSLYNTGATHFLNITGFINVYNSEKKLSQNVKNQTSINETIESAINYIEQSQLLEGSWNDIFNDAGTSDIWATSFVTYFLKDSNILNATESGMDFILKNKLQNGLWGFNKVWVEDADSSSFALLSLNNNYIIHEYIDMWLKFQNKDGGFTTYKDKNILLSSLNTSYIQSVDGWLQSHFCVSAVAFLVFVELDIKDKNEYEKLRNYIIEGLKSNKKTLSYWWREDIYAIYFILLGAVKANDIHIISLCEKRIGKLIEQKKELNYFFKGFLLRTLNLTDSLFNKYSKEIKKLLSQILSNQFTDGSWKEDYSLMMPHPSIINLSNEDIVWREGNKGTNIVVKDYNRVFTTVSCLTALKNHESSK